MSQGMKRLAGMRRNPRDGWTIADIETVCRAHGVSCDPPANGSHYKVSHPSQIDILTIPMSRPIKPVYIRQLVAFIDRVEEERNDR